MHIVCVFKRLSLGISLLPQPSPRAPKVFITVTESRRLRKGRTWCLVTTEQNAYKFPSLPKII